MAGGGSGGFVQVGRRLGRPEDLPLLRGAAAFVADLDPAGRVEAAFVRSWAAHARVARVDLSRARASPGVLDAYAAADLATLADVPAAARSGQPEGMRRRPLAEDRVRFVGEPLALVVADDRYRAEDAAGLVEVDLDPLPAVLDPLAALDEGAVALFEGLANCSSTRELGRACEAELADSPVLVTTVVDNQRLAPMSLEARAILVAPDGDGLRVFCSHQAPHRLRDALAGAFGLDPAHVRVTVPFAGGAFGAKSQVYAEYLAVTAAALRLRRPVRWIEDRSEAFTAATHGRGQHTTLRLGLDEDGRFLALDADIVADVGAYPHTGDFIPELTAWLMSGPYRIPALHVRTRSVVTNKTPTASYRGAGRPEAAFALERLVEVAAARLRTDSVELRRRNLVADDAFPYASPTGALYDSGRYGAALEAAVGAIGLPALREEQARRRARGEGPLLGVGVACWVERSGGEAGSSEYARVELTTEGELVARIGTATQGQGHLVAFAQVVAEATGAEVDEVTVVLGDTGEVRQGTGAFGSRSMQVGGNAAYLAATDLVEQARGIAATLLGCDPPALRRRGSRFEAPGGEGGGGEGGGDSLSLAEIGTKAGPLSAERVFAPPQAFPFGCYAAAVEVDRDTGAVRILRLVAVDDCGTLVNPLLVEGQIVGSIAQGIGQALYEAVRYDDAGNPLTTTLLDYAVPTAYEIPPIELVPMATPNPNVPLGTKGAGESGTIGAPPAVVNAVVDALAGFDTTGLSMPLTPERVWACLQRPLAADPAPPT